MTKKHFEALAAALKGSQPDEIDHDQAASVQMLQATEIAQWRADVRAVAAIMTGRESHDNWWFYTACGYETEGIES